MSLQQPLQLDYASHSYLSVQVPQQADINTILASKDAGLPDLQDVGAVGPDDMASSRVICVNGVPSADQPALEALQVFVSLLPISFCSNETQSGMATIQRLRNGSLDSQTKSQTRWRRLVTSRK
jgi:hypothetical protein